MLSKFHDTSGMVEEEGRTCLLLTREHCTTQFQTLLEFLFVVFLYFPFLFWSIIFLLHISLPKTVTDTVISLFPKECNTFYFLLEV